MNKALKTILMILINRKCIGGVHTPEKRLIVSKIKYLDANDRKQFKREYKKMIDIGYIIREKKKTGKGTGWHITLNPRRIGDIMGLI